MLPSLISGPLFAVGATAYAISLIGPWALIGFVILLLMLPVQVRLLSYTCSGASKIRSTLNWKNLATPLGIISGKSLKRTSYDIEKHRITKFLCVSFSFTSRHLPTFLKCYKMGKTL